MLFLFQDQDYKTSLWERQTSENTLGRVNILFVNFQFVPQWSLGALPSFLGLLSLWLKMSQWFLLFPRSVHVKVTPCKLCSQQGVPQVVALESTFTGLSAFLSLGRAFVITERFGRRSPWGRASSCRVPLGTFLLVLETVFWLLLPSHLQVFKGINSEPVVLDGKWCLNVDPKFLSSVLLEQDVPPILQ